MQEVKGMRKQKGMKKQQKLRFEKLVLVKMSEEMYEKLRERASKLGLTASAAIRLLIAEWLMKEGSPPEK
jgi:predicted DNA-binding protein